MRIEHLRKRYAPVGEEIKARVYEVWRQWNSTREVATLARWEYRIDRAAGVVYVVHDAEASLDTGALVKRLLKIRRSTDVSELELHWDDASRAEIERRSGVDFDPWWRILTLGTWVNARLIPENELDNVGYDILLSESIVSLAGFGRNLRSTGVVKDDLLTSPRPLSPEPPSAPNRVRLRPSELYVPVR